MVGCAQHGVGLYPVSRYRHLFFDLDHTLWDFTTNSRATLRELHRVEGLSDAGVPDADVFIAQYEAINHALWAEYGSGRMPKEVLRVLRFRRVLGGFNNVDGRLAERLSRGYIEQCPLRTELMPGARELLAALTGRYSMHIITNGFDEVQAIKLRNSGLREYFDVVLTSERAGAAKPDVRIFEKAMERSCAARAECLMIGDNVGADMEGARRAGWDHVHYAAETPPDPLATYRIQHLDELRAILL